MTLTNPSLFPEACAFPDAENGNLPTLISYPFSIACSSVYPTEAISGLQYVQPGWNYAASSRFVWNNP